MTSPILVALSGGVDSSVAALRLIEAGHRVEGATLRLWDSCGKEGARSCCALEDAVDARAVARHLGIPHRILDHGEAFERLVVRPFAEAYASGRTPNPCILCNERVKFGTLLEYALDQGFSHLATGHHARIVRAGDGFELRRGTDGAKDQSYVLFPLGPQQRARALFPVGEMTKEEVRRRASEEGLPTAEKPESQDLCFAPAGDYAALLEGKGTRPAEGPIRHEDGRVLGRHGGLHRFTVGQRQGIGIPAPEPLYVVRIDPCRNELVVGPKSSVDRPSFTVAGWRWHSPPGSRPARALVQTRYRQEPAQATILEEGDTVVVRWTGETRTSAPGQAAVAYVGDAVAGGGWIL
jgi:tRNA-uridine 2-sulfurtransferase